MKIYTGCFIGIPIPEKYQQNYNDLLEKITQINPLFKQPDLKIPHITVCYLGKQSQADLQKIAEKVKKSLKILKNVQLEIGGFGYFKGNDPKILFLDVDYPASLKEFNKVVTKSLSVYLTTEKTLPFIPHVTVAWVGDPEAQQAFKSDQAKLKVILDKVSWPFKITEVVLYGADSARQPEYQEALISLAVK